VRWRGGSWDGVVSTVKQKKKPVGTVTFTKQMLLTWWSDFAFLATVYTVPDFEDCIAKSMSSSVAIVENVLVTNGAMCDRDVVTADLN